MKTFAFSDLNRQSGEVLDAALVEPVTLTKRGKPKLVMLRHDEFRKLVARRAYTIENAPDDVHAELMEAVKDILAEK